MRYRVCCLGNTLPLQNKASGMLLPFLSAGRTKETCVSGQPPSRGLVRMIPGVFDYTMNNGDFLTHMAPDDTCVLKTHVFGVDARRRVYSICSCTWQAGVWSATAKRTPRFIIWQVNESRSLCADYKPPLVTPHAPLKIWYTV